jgi:hypothetical protein
MVFLTLTGAVKLANQGDTVRLSDAEGNVVDQVAYQCNQVRAGRTIVAGRDARRPLPTVAAWDGCFRHESGTGGCSG